MDPAGTDALIDAIRHMHGCEATWVESVPVTERYNGKVVWDGEVEVQVFSVSHTKATRCYAWSYSTEGHKRRFVPKGDAKGRIFSVRLSPHEREKIEHAATNAGISASEWARQVLLSAVIASTAQKLQDGA